MPQGLDWQRDGHDWPLRESSRFVHAAGLRWHVQRLGPPSGQAPTLLLLHGTGASTHSWRDLMPLLARGFDVIAPDLPGHAFTQSPPDWQLSLPGMAGAVSALMASMGVRPALIAGHSAGAAVAARMCLDHHATPAAIVSLNGALLPLGGVAGQVFSPVARLMASTSIVPRLFSWRASDPTVLRRLLDATGSRLDARGTELYGRLVRNPGHAAGALGMMANWDLQPLVRDLRRLPAALTLVVGERDGTVPPSHSQRVQAIVPGSTLVSLPGLGHLAHEERPEVVVECIRKAALAARLQPAA